MASATSHGCTFYLGFGSSSSSAPSSWGSANSSISQTNAGTYYVWYKGTADGNHSANIGNTYKGTVTVSKINPTCTAPTSKGTLIYNRSAQQLYNSGSYTTPGSFSYTGGSQTNIGTYTVSWKFTPNDTTNYNSVTGSFNASIVTNFKPYGSDSFVTSDGKYFTTTD